MQKIFYLNGTFVSQENALISIGDIAVGRGYGVFDYFQIKDGCPIFWEEHLKRFLGSCQSLRLPITESMDTLKEVISELSVRNHIDNAGIKLIATGGVSPDGFSPGIPNIGIQVLPYYEPPQSMVEEGVKLLSYEYQRLLPHIKSTNYLYNVYLAEELKKAGAMEPLYYTRESVRETARANIFAVIGGTLITCGDKVLSGINREKVLGLGYPVELRNISLEEMKSADEVFLTGTTKRAIAVRQIDQEVIGDGHPGKITMDIRNKLLRMEDSLVQTAS